MSEPRRRWTVRAVWGDRGESPADVGRRLRQFLDLLANLDLGLDAWFVAMKHHGRETFWDARGSSGVIERALERSAESSDFGQGLPPMKVYATSLVDPDSVRLATCDLVIVVGPPPLPVWFPNSAELSFDDVPGDPVLRVDKAMNILNALSQAMNPRWGFFDPERPSEVDFIKKIQARPETGRLTYLADEYGTVPPLSKALPIKVDGGTVVMLETDRLAMTDDQDAGAAQIRHELHANGNLLTRDQYEARGGVA